MSDGFDVTRQQRRVAPAPQVDQFTCVSVTFLRGEGITEDPVRQCTAYYRKAWSSEDEDGMSLIAVYDPEVGIDPARFPPKNGVVFGQ